MKIIRSAGLLLIAGGAAMAQNPAGSAFDVASVKRATPEASGGIQYSPGGKFSAGRTSLRALIQEAWGLRNFEVAGGVDWMASEFYVVQAQADKPVADSEMKAMLQALLVERFHLVLHHETRAIPVYVLTVGDEAKVRTLRNAVSSGGKGQFGIGRGTLTATSVQLFTFANVLSTLVDRPVVDTSGLDGDYTFKLEYDQNSVKAPMVGLATDGEPTGYPSFFTAIQRQAGLKLVPQARPTDVLVIDSAQRPAEN